MANQENGRSSPGTDLTPMSENVLSSFEGFGQEESSGGAFGRFTKEGLWVFGMENEEPGQYEVFAVDMMSAARGWICWKNSQVQDEVMYPVAGGRSVMRTDLTDHGPYGQGDGWSEQASLKLKSIEGREQILIKGSSRGFRNMASKLCKDFASHVRNGGGDRPVPLIILDASHYPHKKYGRINIPLAHIVGWATTEELMGDLPAARLKELETEAKARLEERRASSRR